MSIQSISNTLLGIIKYRLYFHSHVLHKMSVPLLYRKGGNYNCTTEPYFSLCIHQKESSYKGIYIPASCQPWIKFNYFIYIHQDIFLCTHYKIMPIHSIRKYDLKYSSYERYSTRSRLWDQLCLCINFIATKMSDPKTAWLLTFSAQPCTWLLHEIL